MKAFRVVAAAVCIIFLSGLICIGCLDGKSYVLGASPPLTVSISPTSAAFNLGQSQLLTAVPSGGSGSYTSYQWYVGGSVQPGQTASTFNYSPTIADLYSITVTVTDSTGATSAQSNQAMVMVVVGLSVSVSPGTATLNVGQSQLFTANFGSGPLPPMEYQWYVDETAQPGQTASTFNYSPASAGTYSITVMVSNSTGFPIMMSSPATLTASVTEPSNPTPTPTPISTPNQTPTSPETTVTATTSDSSTVHLAISGNITSSQMSDVTITTNQTAKSTAVSFTVTGESGTIGFGNITIPKTALPIGATPTIYVDGQPAQNQGYTQDSNNYYVWYTTHFSTHQISIVFTAAATNPNPNAPISQTPAQSSLLQVVYGVAAALAIVAIVIVAFKLVIKDKPSKN